MSRRLRSEDGLTLTEVLVGAIIGVILSLALFSFLDTTSKSSEQTAARIDAAKLGRPVMASIVDRLRSTCVAPDIKPIQAGSRGDRLIFLNQTGSGVTLTPDRRLIQYSPPVGSTPGNLTETVYRATGGTPPDWTFASVGTTRKLIEPVRGVGGSSAVFTYFAYAPNGTMTQLNPPTAGLSADDAANVVQVKVAFEVPARTGDSSQFSTFSDSVLFRFSPPAADSSTENLPCA